MSRALIWTSLRLSQWAIVAWAVLLILYGFLILLLYPAIQESSGPVLGDYLRSLPEGLLASMGLTQEVLDKILTEQGFSIAGFIGTEYLAWWPVMAGIYAFIFGSGAVAREAERGTMELLLSHPVSRAQVVASKFLAFLAIAGLLVIATVAGISLGDLLIDENLDLLRVFLAILQGGLAAVTIASYSLLISCITLDPRKAMALAGGIMAVQYILGLLGPLLDSFAWVQRLSLFYYYRPLDVMVQGQFALSSVLVYSRVSVACLAAALVVFQRRKAVV
ncbi:MAG: ABC transporter permease subunit [Chloroflexota bacterium]